MQVSHPGKRVSPAHDKACVPLLRLWGRDSCFILCQACLSSQQAVHCGLLQLQRLLTLIDSLLLQLLRRGRTSCLNGSCLTGGGLHARSWALTLCSTLPSKVRWPWEPTRQQIKLLAA